MRETPHCISIAASKLTTTSGCLFEFLTQDWQDYQHHLKVLKDHCITAQTVYCVSQIPVKLEQHMSFIALLLFHYTHDHVSSSAFSNPASQSICQLTRTPEFAFIMA